MRQVNKKVLIFSIINLFYNLAYAGPWFTGPIFAPSGHTVARGHTNVEIYGLEVLADGHYDQNGHVVRNPLFSSTVINPIASFGATDWLDIQLSIPYAFNNTQGQSNNNLADVSLGFGLQLLEQKKSAWQPDLRFVLQETFPSGRYENLNPFAAGTDSTGLGSYQTQLSLNFQWLKELADTHFLRTRLSLTHIFFSQVKVHGLNSYGGTLTTLGTINPGTEDDIDLAFEYTLTQQWVAVMEGYVSFGQSSKFNGILDTANIGGPQANSGVGNYFEAALAPALEYNFTEKVGLIGGVWFPVSGKNTPHYVSYVLALNAYW